MSLLTKAEIARRQLGTALDLYLAGKDPVSVHCLACGGCEIAEHLALQAGQPTMRHFALLSNPKIDDKIYTQAMTQYWNAFKHAKTLKGQTRSDDALLGSFSERENEERLFVGWSNYGFANLPLPIEAQVFISWFMALDASKFPTLEGVEFLADLDQRFPALRELSPDRQMRRLRNTITTFKRDKILLTNSKTDRRPLILPLIS